MAGKPRMPADLRDRGATDNKDKIDDAKEAESDVAFSKNKQNNDASDNETVNESSDAGEDSLFGQERGLTSNSQLLDAFRRDRPLYETTARAGLYLRSGPGQQFKDLSELELGTKVYVLKREGDWAQIDREGDGAADGFVHWSYLKVSALKNDVIAEDVREDGLLRFWAGRNPRGALLYDRGRPLVDPLLLHASALGIGGWEKVHPYRVEIYGPGGGFRTRGSLANHGAQPGTGRGAALDFVLIDLSTREWLTNHPGANHQYQGTAGQNAPLYQLLFNQIVKSGSQLDSSFESKARFGGYFATGDNALDTMHIDMRGRVVPTGGGTTRRGFPGAMMRRFRIPHNHPYT